MNTQNAQLAGALVGLGATITQAMDQIEVFVRALHRHNHELIIAGATGHPLAQLRRTGIAQALGPNLVPNMEFAMARARTVLTELDEKEKSRPVIRTL